MTRAQISWTGGIWFGVLLGSKLESWHPGAALPWPLVGAIAVVLIMATSLAEYVFATDSPWKAVG